MYERLKKINTYGALPREIYILSASNIINRVGCFVSIFFTLYLTQVLELSVKMTGIIISLYGIVCMLGIIIGGKLGDCVNRKYLIITTRIISATLVAISGFILNSPITVVLLFLSGFLKYADRPVYNAMVIDFTDLENRKSSFSLLYISDNLGIALGSALAGFLYNNYIHWVFWGDALTTFVAIFLVFLFIPNSKCKNYGTKVTEKESRIQEKKSTLFRLIFCKPYLVIFTLSIILEKFVYTQQSFSLPLYLDSTFSMLGETYYGYLMSFNCIIVLFFSNIVFIMTKKFKPIVNLTIGSALYGVGFGILYLLKFDQWVPIIYISTFIWTIGEILNSTNQSVYIANNSPENYYSRFSGFFQTSMTLGKSICSFISGYFVSFFGLVNIWIVVIVASMILMVSNLFISKMERTYIKEKER